MYVCVAAGGIRVCLGVYDCVWVRMGGSWELTHSGETLR